MTALRVTEFERGDLERLGRNGDISAAPRQSLSPNFQSTKCSFNANCRQPGKGHFGPQSQTKGRKENPAGRERKSNDFKLMPRFIRKNAAAAAMSAPQMHHPTDTRKTARPWTQSRLLLLEGCQLRSVAFLALHTANLHKLRHAIFKLGKEANQFSFRANFLLSRMQTSSRGRK